MAAAAPEASGMAGEICRRNPKEVYKLMQRLGCGTYGSVYKGMRIETGELAAIKVCRFESAAEMVPLQQEIAMMKGCHHENIVTYYGSYYWNKKFWICMEFCGGGSLHDIYNVTGPLQERQIAFCCREVTRGLAYLHGQGMMHRDIKGANILLTDGGNVKLADFGVSQYISSREAKRKTLIGTPFWMAPEMALADHGGGYNQLCDIWAVGITSIELAELQPPWYDLHPQRVLTLLASSKLKPPPGLKDKTKWSPDFHNFIKVTLTKNPKKRPTAEKLLKHDFLRGHLTKALTLELLDRARNPLRSPDSSDLDEDEALERISVPLRIPSKPSKERTKSELNMESVNFDPPLVTALSAEPPPARYPDPSSDWGSILEKLDDVKFDFDTAWTSEEDRKGGEDDPEANYCRDPTLPLPSDEGEVVAKGSSWGRDGAQEDGTLKQESTATPTVPPRRRDRRRPTPPRIQSNGLPPTPKVHMGAGFTKIFNGCPLTIHCSASWVHPATRNQHILIGSDEGIFSLNLKDLADDCMELIYRRRTTWMFVMKDVLMSISGKTPHVYSHDLVALHARKQGGLTTKLSVTLHMNRIPDRLVPKRFAPSTRLSETKGMLRCCVRRNPLNGYKYLCGASTERVFLMQWYDPLHKFMTLKTFDCNLPPRLRTFEMVFVPDAEYPRVCVDVRVPHPESAQLCLEMLDLNSDAACLTPGLDAGGQQDEQALAGHVNLKHVSQLDRHTLLVCHDNVVQFVDLDGKLKTTPGREGPAELAADFEIEGLVCLTDSILMFHRHGLQGRSIKEFAITQNIFDESRTFRLLGSERTVVLESRSATLDYSNPESGVNLYILTGHENSY
ncbi:unnamed protein product [Cyprideis torosa]|uniref:Mitogen-activated protein kinase kinase kinase kinase n=1 Tax=Cyprideis torosa TaxID=163714 RepID=A0A7R8ZME2_9CRUS|nr:unnamed protein product [Cyprideis torosa]CAG0884133.1 unnamed protein product [Cyprideis torosa]